MITKSDILIWAQLKGLLKKENRYVQSLKVVEEVGELAKSIIEDNRENQIDSIGDVVITLVILSEQLGLDINQCTKQAFNEIKNRKGETINGTFIKEK
jgi:NTP pyrophosphatase (non-canonical NTP hydrolase)